jgi:phage shock protein PspC (stress-responsive transcriptional regulator)
MKKVININFQGRVVPIEETAYEMLQNYISSLRSYFANEEGRDEIINDIENRIGELFSETLKKGAACITDDDVNKVISSIGRPEDFEEADAGSDAGSSTQYQQAGQSYQSYSEAGAEEKKRLYRDEEDKILAGVASGIAHYLKVDPAVVRIIFALLAIFGGSGFLIYIILWIVLPSRSLVTNIRKRLYRDPDDKVIAGVCGGLGKYFDINPAIPRVIFAAPFIFGIITSIGRSFFHEGPFFVGSFGGGTFILIYIILWIVLPEALTASEKLEMRGEKVDINSIRDTVMSDLQGVKGRAQKMGKEFQASAQRMGEEMKESFSSAGSNVASDIRQSSRSSRGIGNAIAILVKAFVYFILACVGFALFVALIALLGAGVGVLPVHDFLLQGSAQYFFALGSIVLFIGVPIISILVWFIRRLMKVRTHNKYLGYSFTALWLLGLFCVIGLLGSLNRGFSSQVGIRNDVNIEQPAGNKLVVQVEEPNYAYYDGWFDMDGILSIDRDTLYVNTVRVNVVKSKDSLYHVHLMKISRGRDREQAKQLAERIEFTVTQKDSLLLLPESFKITKNDKWRNQRVIVVIEVPVGKEIYMGDAVNDYEYFNVEFGQRRNWRIDWNREWEDGEYWEEEKTMKMTNEGLEWDKRRRDNNGDWNNEPSNPEPGQKTDTLVKPQPATVDTVYKYKKAVTVVLPDENGTEETADPSSNGNRRITNPLASVMKLF